MQAIRLLVCAAVLQGVAVSSSIPALNEVRFNALWPPLIHGVGDATEVSRGLGAIDPLLSNCAQRQNPPIDPHLANSQQLDAFLIRGEFASHASECPEMRTFALEDAGSTARFGDPTHSTVTELPVEFHVAHGTSSPEVSFRKLRTVATADAELPEVQVVPEPPPMILVGLLLLAAGYLRKNAVGIATRRKSR